MTAPTDTEIDEAVALLTAYNMANDLADTLQKALRKLCNAHLAEDDNDNPYDSILACMDCNLRADPDLIREQFMAARDLQPDEPAPADSDL